MEQVVEIFPHWTQGPEKLSYMVNTIVANNLATQGARASAAMVFT